MNVVVFVGPTLAREEARAELDATYLPPAGQGDIYLAVSRAPDAIALIDGYFKHTPAVWHKEILWALSQGIHVFGASSMGALRACEMAPFGMVGVGHVFEQFASGVLEDDDEVTIIHSDQATNFTPLSDAMVNIRATLSLAVEQGVISQGIAEDLVTAAKGMHYGDRSYQRLLAHAPVEARAALEPWLGAHQVDVKRSDALALLQEIQLRQASGQLASPFQPEFEFAHTDAWEQVRREIRLKELRDVKVSAGVAGDAVLNELRLRDASFSERGKQALAHALSQELAQGWGDEIDQTLLETAVREFRVRHQLESPEQARVWLEEQGMDARSLTRLLKEDQITRRYRALFDAELERTFIDLLRLSGEYGPLLARAEQKQQVLSDYGLTNPGLEAAKIDENELWAWFVGTRHDLDESVEPRDLALELGYRDVSELLREVLREWLFRKYG